VTRVDCCYEDDVLDALTSGRWPDRADEGLRIHVASCAICADIVDVAGAILEGRDDRVTEMRIPSSAVMWWRAQMRARQEAAREASRPITIAQIVASISAVALIIAAVVVLSPWFGVVLGDWMDSARAALAATTVLAAAPSTSLTHGWMIPAIIIGVSLLLAPVAIYFAVADD
jgi:hypothetical protein